MNMFLINHLQATRESSRVTKPPRDNGILIQDHEDDHKENTPGN